MRFQHSISAFDFSILIIKLKGSNIKEHRTKDENETPCKLSKIGLYYVKFTLRVHGQALIN